MFSALQVHLCCLSSVPVLAYVSMFNMCYFYVLLCLCDSVCLFLCLSDFGVLVSMFVHVCECFSVHVCVCMLVFVY